jgi:hypothetical protein
MHNWQNIKNGITKNVSLKKEEHSPSSCKKSFPTIIKWISYCQFFSLNFLFLKWFGNQIYYIVKSVLKKLSYLMFVLKVK